MVQSGAAWGARSSGNAEGDISSHNDPLLRPRASGGGAKGDTSSHDDRVFTADRGGGAALGQADLAAQLPQEPDPVAAGVSGLGGGHGGRADGEATLGRIGQIVLRGCAGDAPRAATTAFRSRSRYADQRDIPAAAAAAPTLIVPSAATKTAWASGVQPSRRGRRGAGMDIPLKMQAKPY